MKKTKDGRRRLFSREFKVAAVRRVLGGEKLPEVARDLELGRELLGRWKKRVEEKSEEALFDAGRRKGQAPIRSAESIEAAQQRRIAELERLVGHQQLEIRFLDKALRRVEELRQQKNDDGAAASTKR